MKYSTIATGLLVAQSAYGFPCAQMPDMNSMEASMWDAVKRDPAAAESLLLEHSKEAWKRDAEAAVEPTNNLAGLKLSFGGGLLNGKLQKLTGALAGLELPTPQPQGHKAIPGNDPNHQFKKPSGSDIRGMCPTLNALANHGYISRSGVTTFAEAANAVQTGYGFTFGLSVFLSAVGLLAGGDLPSGKYTIAGADSRNANGLDSHGVFEIDGSITRQDVYWGNNANFLKPRWTEYIAISKKHDGLFELPTQAEDNGYRYDISRNHNPQFFAGVIWFIVSHAARVFVYEGLANGTETGRRPADYKNVAPFFLDERFPEDWYRRGSPHSLPAAFMQAGAMFLTNPRELGGNNGVGKFVPLAGKPSVQTPADVACFALKNFFDLAPDEISSAVAKNLNIAQGFMKGVVLPFFREQ